MAHHFLSHRFKKYAMAIADVAWCKENGIEPPPGSFEENMNMTTGA